MIVIIRKKEEASKKLKQNNKQNIHPLNKDSMSLSLSLSHTHTHTHALTHARTHTLSHTHTDTHTRTRTRARARTHTHTHTQNNNNKQTNKQNKQTKQNKNISNPSICVCADMVKKGTRVGFHFCPVDLFFSPNYELTACFTSTLVICDTLFIQRTPSPLPPSLPTRHPLIDNSHMNSTVPWNKRQGFTITGLCVFHTRADLNRSVNKPARLNS